MVMMGMMVMTFVMHTKDPLYPFSSSSFPSTPLARAVIASPPFPRCLASRWPTREE